MSNQATEGGTSTMVVVKCSDKVEGSGDNIYSPLCGGLYKEEEDSLVPWLGTDPDANMNCFTWSKDNNDWIVSEDQYDDEFKTGEDLYIMFDSVHRPSRRKERQRRYAPSIQSMPSLMAFVEKESHRYPSSLTRIYSVSILSGMECGTSSPFHTHVINRRGGIFLYISLDFPWNI